MARARLLKPGFFKNDELAKLSHAHRLLFAGLWTIADREGRLEDRADRIRVEIFPYEPAIPIDSLLNELHEAGFIQRYVIGPLHVVQIPRFNVHQSPHHKEPKSDLPPPPAPRDRSASSAGAVNPSMTLYEGMTRLPSRVSPPDPDPVPDPVSGDPVPDPDPDPGTRSGDGSKSSVAHEARRAVGFHAQHEKPTDNVGIITKIAHEVMDQIGMAHPDVSEAVKNLCATRRITYTGRTVAAAIDSACYQRTHRRESR